MKSLIVVLCVTLLTLVQVGHSKEKPLKVFVCAGQSNMVGKRSISSDLPKNLQAPQKNLFFNGKSWVALTPRVTEKKGFGPEISFASAMSIQLKEPVGIIKHSIVGTNLAKQWSPNGKKSLYKAMINKVIAAQKTRNIEIVGMIWMQGESDAVNKAMASSYQKNLSEFIQAARKDLNSPDMIFVSGRINSPKPVFAYTDIVRKAQEQCNLPRYAYIDCDTLEKGTDNIHYTTRGIVEMGQKFAEAMLKIIKGK